MTKLSLLIELLKCKICKSILDDPVLIPCGESVCACHITTGEFLKSRHSDVCLICEQRRYGGCTWILDFDNCWEGCVDKTFLEN